MVFIFTEDLLIRGAKLALLERGGKRDIFFPP
jgi:hypothetical protein